MRHEAADVELPLWQRESVEIIRRQSDLVAGLTVGSEAHRRAVESLLLLQDSYFVLTQADEMLARLREPRQR